MGTYMTGVVLTVGIAAIVSCMTPEGRGRRSYHLLLSLVVLLVLTAPIAAQEGCEVIGELSAGEEEILTGGERDVVLTATAMALRETLATHFHRPEEEIGVTVGGQVTEAGEVTLARVTVVLSGESARERLAVLTYLEEALPRCEVMVYVA